MGKILVTGGAGYIGSQTNLLLLEKGYRTIVFDSLENGHKEVIPSKSIFIKGDLLNSNNIKNVFDKYKIEAVVHFAGYIAVGESMQNPGKYYRNNVVGSINLLEEMSKAGLKKFVFSSSAAVYGIPDLNLISENASLKPISPYGKTKLIVENLLDDYFNAHGLSSISLRYFNACGADLKLRTGENHKPETHLIPLVLQTAIGKTPKVVVYGNNYPTFDGTCIRDYIHVLDLANAHILAIEKLLSGENINEKINLGIGKGYSVMEIIKKAKEISGKDFKVEIGERRLGDPAKLIADNKKAKKFLGWQPRYSDLDTIISTAWRWQKKKEVKNKK